MPLPYTHATRTAQPTSLLLETIATLPGGWDLFHASRLGIKPFAELGANSQALSGSQVDSPCSCRAIFESAPVALLQSLSFTVFFTEKGKRKGTKSRCLPTVKQTAVFFTPSMLDFRISLEARNPARRCSWQYRVEAGTDLFGIWVVKITYGRIGTAGRSRCYVVRDEEEARHLAQSILKRRATAPRRIGGRVPHPRADRSRGVGRGLMRQSCERGEASRDGAAPRDRAPGRAGTLPPCSSSRFQRPPP